MSTHTCPGSRCLQSVPSHLFACKMCWFRLPADIRTAISENYRINPDAHFAAVLDAVKWYAENSR